MNAATPIIELHDLTLSRGEQPLIAGLSLSIFPSEAVWVTGPNGVGKTTLLLACAGLLTPDTGRIAWAGGRAEQTIAYAPFIGPERDGLTLGEELVLWQTLSGDTAGLAERLASVGLTGLEATPIGGLSAGQRRRLSLARLLGSAKDVWLLDEPFAGLDTAGQSLVAEQLSRHLSAGGCAVIASHQPITLPGHAARRLVLEAAA